MKMLSEKYVVDYKNLLSWFI